jgi:hypothetical protein
MSVLSECEQPVHPDQIGFVLVEALIVNIQIEYAFCRRFLRGFLTGIEFPLGLNIALNEEGCQPIDAAYAPSCDHTCFAVKRNAIRPFQMGRAVA